MSEQTANGRRFRLYEIIVASLLGLLGVVLTIMFTMLFTSIQQLSNRVDGLDRKLEALERKVDQNTRILVKMQTTLDVIASGFNIRVEPKEQAGPAATPAPGEKLATKDP